MNPNPLLKTTPQVSNTVFKRAKAWDGQLASMAEVVYGGSTQATHRSGRVSFDGSTERFGTSNHSWETQVKNRIAACREAYENDGIIGNIIDIMVDFSLEKIAVHHKSPAIQNFYRSWARKAKLRDVIEQIIKSIYRDGNVPILADRGKIDKQEIDEFKKSLSKKALAQHFVNDDTIVNSRLIPIRYQLLDVLKLYRGGSEIINTTFWEYQFNHEDIGVLKGTQTRSQDPSAQQAILKLRTFLGDTKFNNLSTTGRIRIDSDRLSMLYYKRDGYRAWANPMLWRVMGDLRYKTLIRNMDISVVEGVTNALTIVKIGDVKEGFPASRKKYAKLVSLLKNPAKSKTLVWDDLIEIETAYPPVEKFLDEKKYQQVDADIRGGLGIPEVLVNGQGKNFSNSFLAIKTLLERLESGRTMIFEWLSEEVLTISKAMGFRRPPVVTMGHMSLTDEEVEKRFLLELFDRNAMSFETLLDHFGENVSIEIERIRKEDAKRELLEESSPFALLRVGKFGPQYPQGPPGVSPGLEEGADETNLPSAQEQQGPKGGRPKGDKKKKKISPKPPKPQGAAVKFDKLYKILGNTVAKSKGHNSLRDLDSDDRWQLLGNIARALPILISQDRWTQSQIESALNLEGDKDEFETVRDVVKSEATKFKRNNEDESPNKTNMRHITLKAIDTVYRIE